MNTRQGRTAGLHASRRGLCSGVLAVGATLALLAQPAGGDVALSEQTLEKIRERLADTSVDHPVLHAQQAAGPAGGAAQQQLHRHRFRLAGQPVLDLEDALQLVGLERFGLLAGDLDGAGVVGIAGQGGRGMQ